MVPLEMWRSYSLAVYHLAQKLSLEPDGTAVDFDLCVTHFEVVACLEGDVACLEAGWPLAAAALRGLVLACLRMAQEAPANVEPPHWRRYAALELAYAARGVSACLRCPTPCAGLRRPPPAVGRGLCAHFLMHAQQEGP